MLAALPALAGCAVLSPTPQTDALRSAPRAARRAELDAVPFFAQTRYHCGPAALATVLVHAGFDAAPDSLADAVFLPAREGSLQAEMLAGARRAGALAVRVPGELDALFREIDAGVALVVLQNLGLAIAPAWHYAVLVGYDLDTQRVVLRSGTTRRELMDFTLFERTWARGGHWAFAAVRPGRLPVTATEADAVQAALGFERAVTSAARRAEVYDSLLARWPRNLAALVGQGNARAAQDDWRGAAASFERAAQWHDSAAAWHNLALARQQLGELDVARRAAQRALARADSAEPAWRAASQALVDQLNDSSGRR